MLRFRAMPVAVVVLFLSASPSLAQAKKLAIKSVKDRIDFLVGDELVSSYQTGDFSKPIFWPLNAPGGIPLTRAWPMVKGRDGESTDHIHQKSAWFCYGDVIPEGIEIKHKIRGVEGVDFWAESAGHGKIVCVEIKSPAAVDVYSHMRSSRFPCRFLARRLVHTESYARVVTKNEWRTADGVGFMDEIRVLSLHDLGNAHLIVLDIDLHASVAPITFGDTKEGALGIRINDQIAALKTSKGKIQNAEGKVGEKECWGHISAWCDYSGPIGGKMVGLAILADPNNPYPSCWHVRGYGLMAANPFGRAKSKFPAVLDRTDLVRLAKGEHLRLRYGLLMHEGDAVTGQVAEHFRRFVELRLTD